MERVSLSSRYFARRRGSVPITSRDFGDNSGCSRLNDNQRTTLHHKGRRNSENDCKRVACDASLQELRDISKINSTKFPSGHNSKTNHIITGKSNLTYRKKISKEEDDARLFKPSMYKDKRQNEDGIDEANDSDLILQCNENKIKLHAQQKDDKNNYNRIKKNENRNEESNTKYVKPTKSPIAWEETSGVVCQRRNGRCLTVNREILHHENGNQCDEDHDDNFKIHYVFQKNDSWNNHSISRKHGSIVKTENETKKFTENTLNRMGTDRNSKTTEMRDNTNNRNIEITQEKHESSQRRRRWSYSLRQLMRKDNQVVTSLKTRSVQTRNSLNASELHAFDIDMNNANTLGGIEDELEKFKQNLKGMKNELNAIENCIGCNWDAVQQFKKEKFQFEEITQELLNVSYFHELKLDVFDGENPRRERFETI